MSPINLMLTGGIAVASLIASLYFFRFWRQTRDRFFLYFSLSFFLEAGDRVALGMLARVQEDGVLPYSIRVVAFGLIILAIWQKNRPR